jgi:hypothetical protein
MTTSGTDAGLGGHEERQALVLDLPEATDWRASRRIAVGDRPPAPERAVGCPASRPSTRTLSGRPPASRPRPA